MDTPTLLLLLITASVLGHYFVPFQTFLLHFLHRPKPIISEPTTPRRSSSTSASSGTPISAPSSIANSRFSNVTSPPVRFPAPITPDFRAIFLDASERRESPTAPWVTEYPGLVNTPQTEALWTFDDASSGRRGAVDLGRGGLGTWTPPASPTPVRGRLSDVDLIRTGTVSLDMD